MGQIQPVWQAGGTRERELQKTPLERSLQGVAVAERGEAAQKSNGGSQGLARRVLTRFEILDKGLKTQEDVPSVTPHGRRSEVCERTCPPKMFKRHVSFIGR